MRKLVVSFATIALTVGALAAPSEAVSGKPAKPPVGTLAIVPIFDRPLPAVNKFIPPHTRGDKEYKGHGPDVHAEARLNGVGTNSLVVRLFMKAVETKSDWTTAEGHSPFFTIYVAPPGQCIRSVNVGTFDEIDYRDTDHAEDSFPGQTMGSFVATYFFIGDTSGDEAGTETGMAILTKPFTADVGAC